MDERSYAPQTVMADGRQKKSSSSNCSNKQRQTKLAKWSSNSKFNKIFNNIERSILAQFNGNLSSSDSTDHRHNNNDSSRRHQAYTSQSMTTTTTTNSSPTKTKAIITTKSANKKSPPLEPRSEAQNDAATHPSQMDRVTSELQPKSSCGAKELASTSSQPTPANRNGKMILNKYQQQIVSAMQTNKNRPAAGISSSSSSYSHNRLSIPPPHANDEARNQNHQLLFGRSRVQPSDFDSTNDQTAPIYGHARNVASIKLNTVDQQPALFYHSSASPASSAQSLPVTKPGFSRAPPNRLQINAVDDEESGFCTYQSRRVAAANNYLPSTNRISNDFGKPESNTMFMQANQLQLGNITNIGLNNLTQLQRHQQQQQQQQTIHQNMLQSRITQQQSTNNTQQHQLNQVPISQGFMYDSNLHIQDQMNSHHHQQQQNTNGPGDNRNQTYDFYGHLGPATASQVPMQQQYQPKPQYDGQIYANAPPKPRRYQYYDPSFTINSHLVVPSRTSQNYPPPHPTQFIGHQISGPPGRQFSYNAQDDHQAQVYSQRQGEFINVPQIPYKPQRQLPMLPQPPTLTKSKSSLDVADLTRFKQDRIQTNGMLRVQPHSLNVPIYGSTRYINQMDSSTLQRNPDYHPQITINYQTQKQQPPTNLQRSKSIGNLLPEYNSHEISMTPRQFPASNHMQQQQSIASVYPKFLTVSSASTNNLNYVGLANNNTILTNNISRQTNQIMQQTARPDNNNVNNPIQKQHQQQFLAAQTGPLPPMRQSYQQRPSNGGMCWPNLPQTKSTAYNNGDGEITKTNTNTTSNSGKIVRQSHNGNANSNSMAPAEGSGFVSQSLDDKIRHLLIGDGSTSGGGANDSNNKLESREVALAWPVQQQSQLQISRQTQSSQKEAGSHSVPACGASKSLADRQQDQAHHNSKSDELLVREKIYQSDAASTSMGNRHQRQYQVGGVGGGAQDQQMRVSQRNAGNNCDSITSINSQLIVDLTTPRVLAKTQTTLLPGTSLVDQASRPQKFRLQEAWSMNQLGLPTEYVDQYASNAQSDITNHDHNHLGTTNKVASTDSSSFPAPYYYSDLKSEDQRRALLNIVQQKSLSPPPQLLSRSIDQSNTRLAPKSATMHSGQARMLSETLAASQRRLQPKGPFPDSKSTNNIPGVSSNSSVAKNIDKLFESPIDPQFDQPVTNRLHSVQSMLVLSTNPAGEESCPAISRVSSDQNQIEYLSNSSGYCSDAWKKAGSKSKSLENISQQQLQSVSIDDSIDKSTIQEKLRRYGNPVYENIRRSDKLLSAINNSTTCLSTSSTRHRKSTRNLPTARSQPTSGSDSMDSILGSSFDDDGDDSDQNPGDIDSDNSTNGIDFIKLSPTTADMSELIEQLKNNHAKLTDEYKSTLARISKILNRKDSSGKRKISDKLAGKLQSLEHKSKKCESRSKNQLALIQMMEKACRQTKQKPDKAPNHDATAQPEDDKTTQPSGDDNKIPDVDVSADSPHDSMSLKQTSLSCVNTSPCHSIDYQNLKQKSLPATDNSSQSSGALQVPPPPPPPPVFEAQNVIKAIVTEATSAEIPRKFVAELCKQSKPTKELTTKTIDSVSLSTRHQQVKNQDRNNKDNSRPISNGTVGQRIHSIESTVKRNSKNPFQTDKPEDATTANVDRVDVKQKSSGAFNDELGDDEDDFIEFLSTGSNSTHGRSQFESSQFSASDFNNSSSSGSTSESSHSGSVTTDSLDISSPPSKVKLSDGPVKNTTGILMSGFKSAKSDDKFAKNRQSNRNNNNNINSDDSIHKNNNKDDKARGENKFKNVLGNVIDVDVYPVNMNPPPSPCSSVGNK